LEKLGNLPLCEFLPEPRLFFGAKVTPLALAGCRHCELDVPIVEWGEHLTKDPKQLLISSRFCNFGPKCLILPFPVNASKREKWIPVTEIQPKVFEIPFWIPDNHGCRFPRACSALHSMSRSPNDLILNRSFAHCRFT
jgi:hypothetical protein